MGFKKLLSGIPVIGGAFDDSQEKAQAELKKNQRLWDGLQVPDMQWEQYNPEGYTYAGDYDPTMASADQISEDPLTRSAQMSALQKMAGLADSGMSDEDALGYYRAEQQGSNIAKASRDSALSDARSRGVSGGGLEFALREMGAQSGANRSQEASLEQAAQSAKQRALYNEAYLSGTSNLRNQDYQAEAANTGIINQFNMANTQTGNQAQQFNLGNKQAFNSNAVDQRNQAQQRNQDGRRQTTQQNFANQVIKTNGQAGGNMGAAQGFAAENAANADQRKALGAALGGIVGGGFGGPAGAKVGSAVGSGMG